MIMRNFTLGALGVLGALAIAFAGTCSAQADPIKIRVAYAVPVANWA